MELTPKLFMIMLGGKPGGRLTEQHDIFFAIGTSLKDTVPQIKKFWPEAINLHIDVWREVNSVGGHRISIVPKTDQSNPLKLFFLNLGGYKPDAFDEFHYKMLIVAPTLAEAVKQAKKNAFYKHFGFSGAVSHIDDKYGIDVDDANEVLEILDNNTKATYSIIIEEETLTEDQLHIGYLPLKKI